MLLLARLCRFWNWAGTWLAISESRRAASVSLSSITTSPTPPATFGLITSFVSDSPALQDSSAPNIDKASSLLASTGWLNVSKLGIRDGSGLISVSCGSKFSWVALDICWAAVVGRFDVDNSMASTSPLSGSALISSSPEILIFLKFSLAKFHK